MGLKDEEADCEEAMVASTHMAFTLLLFDDYLVGVYLNKTIDLEEAVQIAIELLNRKD